MMTGQVPELEWFDLEDELERIAREGAHHLVLRACFRLCDD